MGRSLHDPSSGSLIHFHSDKIRCHPFILFSSGRMRPRLPVSRASFPYESTSIKVRKTARPLSKPLHFPYYEWEGI